MFTWEDIVGVSKISMTNITITSWLILIDLTSTDRSAWTDIINKTRLPEQTLLTLNVLLGPMLLVLAVLLTAQKMKFSIKNFFSKCDQIHSLTAGLVTFTEEILHRKLHFLCSDLNGHYLY